MEDKSSLGGEIESLPPSSPRVTQSQGPINITDAQASINLLKRVCLEFGERVDELCSHLDMIGGAKAQYSDVQLADIICELEDALVKQDEIKRVLNRNAFPCRLHLARLLLDKETDEIIGRDRKFTIIGSGHFKPPAKTKDPEKYSELIRWLFKELTGTEFKGAAPTTTVVIDDKALTKLCEKRLSNGEELPPHVSEYPFVTVKSRKLRKT